MLCYNVFEVKGKAIRTLTKNEKKYQRRDYYELRTIFRKPYRRPSIKIYS